MLQDWNLLAARVSIRSTMPACASFLRRAALLAAFSMLPGRVLADTTPTGISETAFRARVRLARGHARITFEREVTNHDPDAGPSALWLGLPRGAVAVGLRLGTPGGWLGSAVLPGEKAQQAFSGREDDDRELSGERALLELVTNRTLGLQIARIPGKQRRTAEISVLAPTSYEEGKDHLLLEGMPPMSLLVEAEGGDQVEINSRRTDAVERLALDEGKAVSLSLRRLRAGSLEGRLAVVPVGKDEAVVHARIEAAARLSEAPKQARVVVLIDASRSLEPDQLDASWAVAQAYLEKLPGARAAVALFDRFVRPLQPSLVPVGEALAALRKAPRERRNGSHVDAALAHAAALLDAPGDGPRRVLLLTDSLTRSELQASVMADRLAASGALVHVVLPMVSRSPSLSVRDGHDWEPGVRATGGLVWAAASPASGGATLAPIVEELVRPTTARSLRYSSSKADLKAAGQLAEALPTELPEGTGADVLLRLPGRVAGLHVEGELWARRIRLDMPASGAENMLWSALVLGDDSLGLSKDDTLRLASLTGAVSSETSRVVAPPGARGFASIQSGDLSLIGTGSGFGRMGGLHSTHRGPSLQALQDFLRGALLPHWKRCSSAGSASVALETTRREVVSVSVSALSGATPAAAACITQAIWLLELSDLFSSRSHASLSVRLE